MPVSIKRLLYAGFLLGTVSGASVGYGDNNNGAQNTGIIPLAENLYKDIRATRATGMPVLIEFSSPGCSYCETLEQEILEPMLRSGDYSDKVVLRKLEVDDFTDVIDFDGQKQAATELAKKYKVDFYPTLIFFDTQGNEIGERLVGLTLLEFYFAELDKALQIATQAM